MSRQATSLSRGAVAAMLDGMTLGDSKDRPVQMTPLDSSERAGTDPEGEAPKAFVEPVSVTLNDAGDAAGWVSKESVDHLWLEVGGELVSELWVVDITVRAWGTELRSAGIAGVATPKPHRTKGYARRLMEACERFTADRRYEISTLFGIPDFYHRFGYATICPEFEIRIELDALEMDGPSASLEEVRRSDWDAIGRLCNASYAALDGTVVRHEGAWRAPRQGSDWDRTPQALVSRDAHGRPAAYAVVDKELKDGCLAVSDAAATSDPAAEALAVGLGQLARASGASALLARLHPRTGLGPLLTRYGGAAVTTRPDNAGYMARIVDLESILRKCTPALTARASASDRPVPSTLNVRTEVGDSCIALGGPAPPAELSVGRMGLVQLLFGYQTFEKLRETGTAHASGVADEVLAALFPRNDGYCFWPDRY